MTLSPTQDQVAFIRQAIESGRISRPEGAAIEAMELWEARERRRAEILAQLDEAEASLSLGHGDIITHESVLALAGDVKNRGRARIAAETVAPG